MTDDVSTDKALVLTALLALLVLLSPAGCGSPCDAGAGTAAASGLTLTTSGGVFTYGSARISPNNDCTPTPGREPTSNTVDMVQIDPTTNTPVFLTLCVPRPDALSNGPVELGFEGSSAAMWLIDVFAVTPGGELFQLDRSGTLNVTATLAGYCGDGLAAAGHSFALAGQVPLTGDGGNEVATLGGSAIAVAPPAL